MAKKSMWRIGTYLLVGLCVLALRSSHESNEGLVGNVLSPGSESDLLAKLVWDNVHQPEQLGGIDEQINPVDSSPLYLSIQLEHYPEYPRKFNDQIPVRIRSKSSGYSVLIPLEAAAYMSTLLNYLQFGIEVQQSVSSLAQESLDDPAEVLAFIREKHNPDETMEFILPNVDDDTLRLVADFATYYSVRSEEESKQLSKDKKVYRIEEIATNKEIETLSKLTRFNRRGLIRAAHFLGFDELDLLLSTSWALNIRGLNGCQVHHYSTSVEFGVLPLKKPTMTGGNTGIGCEICMGLLRAGYTVTLACRSQYKAQTMIDSIDMKFRGNVSFLEVDLANLSSVQRFVECFGESPCDILVNNAGVGGSGKIEEELTVDGFEYLFQVNYLGHFLLTMSLLPKLSKVINLSSSMHRFGTNDYETHFYTHTGQSYSSAKLGNVLLSYELTRRYPSLVSVAVNPGAVDTDIFKNIHWLKQWFLWPIQKLLFLSPVQGASTALVAALDVSEPGLHYLSPYSTSRFLPDWVTDLMGVFSGHSEIQSSPLSYDEELSRRLWELSVLAVKGRLPKFEDVE